MPLAPAVLPPSVHQRRPAPHHWPLPPPAPLHSYELGQEYKPHWDTIGALLAGLSMDIGRAGSSCGRGQKRDRRPPLVLKSAAPKPAMLLSFELAAPAAPLPFTEVAPEVQKTGMFQNQRTLTLLMCESGTRGSRGELKGLSPGTIGS